MENFFKIVTIHLRKALSLIWNFGFVVQGILLVLVSSVLIYFLLIFYKKIRRKFSVRVNCWFCNTYTSVPYDLANCWDCPHCQQYNGFNKEGDYNKVIKEQFNSKLNENVFSVLKSSSTTNCEFSATNGFCKLCNVNQQLKIQQLALFVPLDENKYFEEIEQYREKLEKAYKLCSKCEKTLQETLEKQKYNLLKNRLNSHATKSPLKKFSWMKTLKVKEIFPKIRQRGVFGLRLFSTIIAGILFIALFYNFKTDYHFEFFNLPQTIALECLEPYFKVGVNYLKKIYANRKELSFTGFFFSLICIAESKQKSDHVNLLIWGLIHLLFWSELIHYQVFMLGISLFINVQGIQRKQVLVNKKLIMKKQNFQPESRTVSEVPSAFEDRSTPISDCNLHNYSKYREIVENFGDMKVKKGNKKESEAEILVEPQNKTESSKSVFNHSVLSSPQKVKTEETSFGFLDEVDSNLSELNLGGKQKKSSKPSNFLFANYNFSEKKTSPSIIKPAKFIRNLSNSWTGTELNESVSRSSTPSSSGYSSQKIDKEPTRYACSKAMSPVSVNSFSRPRECFDYYDPHNGFYGCFSPGFAPPFQHFPGPLGHTTVYTFTRPTSFPFSFSPYPGFMPPKTSPSSPRYSDISDTENLFQNASKSFESSKRWFKFKTLSYYFSIFLNVVTFIVLTYFVSAGAISVDWRLPNLNFFT